MTNNYLIIFLRNLLKNKTFTLINVSGLAVGIACCIIMLLYIQNELSYGQYPEHANQLFRVIIEHSENAGKTAFSKNTSGALAPALIDNFPEVQNATRFWGSSAWVQYKDKKFREWSMLADKQFLKVFPFPFLRGTPQTVFQDPSAVAISERMAKRFFGDENPIGKVISIENKWFGGERKITGIFRDISPKAGPFYVFDFLVSNFTQEQYHAAWDQWAGTSEWRPFHTYVRIPEKYDYKILEKKLPYLIEKHINKKRGEYKTYHLQPLTRIRLYSHVDYGMDFERIDYIGRIYQMSTIAALVLLIACVNFTNLTTAQSLRRAREVGMRKTIGAHRSQLIGQFFGESLLLSFLSLLLAIGLVEILLPEFNRYMFRQLTFNFFEDTTLLLGMVSITLFAGVLAGAYPALFMSALHPVVLKSATNTMSKAGWFRKGLVIFQFSTAIFLINSAVVFDRQLSFIHARHLGFNQNDVIVVPLFIEDNRRKKDASERLCMQYNTVKREFLQHPDILKASAYRRFIGHGGIVRTIRTESDRGNEWRIPMLEMDANFLDLFELELIAGRNFSDEILSDNTEAFIVNEAAVKLLGWTDPIGKPIEWIDGGRTGRIVGVVRDFHNGSLRKAIGPVIIAMRHTLFQHIALKVRPSDLPNTIHFIKEKWQQFLPNLPFEFEFADDKVRGQYGDDRRHRRLVSIFSFVCTFLACLGLLGLSSYTTEQRRREIGIRKVLGASAPNLVWLLSKTFLRWVIAANLIAWSATYFAMGWWLNNFAYRIDLSPEILLLGSLLALIVAGMAVSYQCVKTAIVNPVEIIRNE